MKTSPVMLATWSFGRPAISAGWPGLVGGGAAIDAVELACRQAEDDPGNHTVGTGGWPDRDGDVSLDAVIMLSPSKAGGVCYVRRSANPISVARQVMERTPHLLLAGAGADKFAVEVGFPPATLSTDEGREKWEQWRRSSGDTTPVANIERLRNEIHDTIGVLALDSSGVLAGGCTTSGLAWKRPGRVGDSPIVGHGLYVDPVAGACVCTGLGELVSGVCGSFLAVETLRRGGSTDDAVAEVLGRVTKTYEPQPNHQIGVIVLDPTGRFSFGGLRPGYQTAVRTVDRDDVVDAPVYST